MPNFEKNGIKNLFFAHTYPMIKPSKNIADVKRLVNDCRAQRVAVRVNLGRNKSISYSGILSGIYPALFTVKPDEEGFLGKTSYSYSDLLCGNVKIKKLENKEA
ncbi:MAG: ABC transporter permease [Clostridiales bacterium]|nr:ABC transporter permease [Clostridiales bacterium]MBQ3019236.1 Veg family protein [Clostridia bacterium]